MLTAKIQTAAPRFNWRAIDKAWAAFAVILLAVAVLDAAQFWPSVEFTARAMITTLPYLVLAIGLAAYAKASGADNLIARAFSGNIGMMIIFAALFGGLSPFCSCGVIPLIAALLSMGVPLPAVMAFWLASPVMDPSMFLLTMGTLGLPFAVAKTLAAVGLGLFGGYGLLAVQGLPIFANPLRPGVGDGGCGGSKVRVAKPVVWTAWREPERRAAFAKETLNSSLFLGKWLLLAFLLESLMLAYVPGDMIAQVTGGSGVGSITIAALVGVPAYLNGYAALPLAAGLVEQGMSTGVAMAFLVAGGVSSLPAAIAVFALVRLPVFVSYLLFALVGSVVAGLLAGAFI